MKKMSDYERFKQQGPEHTLANRDVYENQQIGRSFDTMSKSMTSRIVLTVFFTIVITIITWILFSWGEWGKAWLYSPETVRGTASWYVFHPTLKKFVFTLFVGVTFFAVFYAIAKHNFKVQTAEFENEDINQYPNDQHIAFPEEIQEKFDWFPDLGATSDVQPSSMISHMAIQNKGLNPVLLTRHYEKDEIDDDGDIIAYRGEIVEDEDGNPVTDKVSMIDTEFMKEVFTASGLPEDKRLRLFYDVTKIPYNPGGKNRDKLGKYDTVADLINTDWKLPAYEPKRPCGAYIVDTAPVNTINWLIV